MFVCVTLLQFAVVLCKRYSRVLDAALYLVVCTADRYGDKKRKCVLRAVVVIV